MQFKENLCKNTFFFSAYILLFLFLTPAITYSNDIGSPYIQGIILNNYGFNNNNYSVIQDKNGVLYISNTNGILQYNGNSWSLIKIEGIPKIAINNEGIIYIGGYNQFGFIKSDNSKHQFVSLLDSTNKELDSLGQIKQVVSFNKSIFFCAKNKLYKWDRGEIILISEFRGTFEIFKVNNKLFVENEGLGLQEFSNGNLVILPNTSFFAQKDIVSIIPYNEQLLIKTKDDSFFYLVDNYGVEKFITEADYFIQKNIFTHACELSNGNYAIGTALSGIVILNKKGEVQTFIDENSGLFNLSVNFLFADESDNLWALHNQGISRIEIPSPYRYFSKNCGLKGNVSSVIRFKGKLYVTTSLGVYYLSENKKSSANFHSVNNIYSQCYDFHVFGNRLFVSGSKGIYEIIDNNAFVFYNRKADEITSVLGSKINSEYIFIGYKSGFSAIRFTNGMFIIEQKHLRIKDKITSIAEDKAGILWLVGNNNRLYKIEPFSKYSKNLEYKSFNEGNGLPLGIDWINLYSINDGILFSTSKGIYRFDREKQQFYLDVEIGLNLNTESNWVYPIVEDSQNNLWLNIIGRDNTKNTTLVKYHEQNTVKTLNPLPLNRLKDFFVTSIHPDNNDIVWFGGFDGLIRLDLKKKTLKKKLFNTLINKVTLKSDSVIYNSPFGSFVEQNKALNIFTYNLNSLAFEFSASDYASEDQLLYQYKLLGFDTAWSNWTSSNIKEYTNLYEGEYKFELRAKNILNQISDTVSYEFLITPPIYRTWVAYILYFITLILLFILIGKWRIYYFARERFRLENIIYERTEEVVIQKEKADNLLERVLPKNTAKELKSGRKAGPYHYNMVTVLFSDIQGFTKVSEQMDSELLIDELDRFFLQFDTVVEKYNIEKIKTIGDAYMCAGGIPIKNRTNPVEVIIAAIEMQNFMKELKRTADDSTSHIWDLRIGVDTGPVIAGVLGKSKISYDIWGGTVNTASRMEASSVAGKINITENTYMLIKDFFICKYRGKMPVKYKGEIDMYFVEGFKPHLSSDLKGQIPNNMFFTQLQLLRVNDVEEFVLTKLDDGLPDNLYYHNVKHTIDVVTQVELIGRSEGISDEEILIIKTAALFHDMGHLVNYDTHEEESIKLAKKILPTYQYSLKQIGIICSLIEVTKMPPEPKNLLEEIMCDADLDYLGRTDFVPVSINLYKELNERKKIDSILEWNKMQTKFIKNHQYFTKTAQKLREVNKNKQLENIMQEIRREIEMDDE